MVSAAGQTWLVLQEKCGTKNHNMENGSTV